VSATSDKTRSTFGERRYAYRTTFKGPLAETVLQDLAIFCRAHASTFNDSQQVMLVLEGRRQVWLRIAEQLHLTEAEAWSRFAERANVS